MTTATCEHLTKERIASEQDVVRHDLARFVNKITNNGKPSPKNTKTSSTANTPTQNPT